MPGAMRFLPVPDALPLFEGSPLAALSRRTNSFFEWALHEGNVLAPRKTSKNNPRTKLCVSIIEDFRGVYMPELQSTISSNYIVIIKFNLYNFPTSSPLEQKKNEYFFNSAQTQRCHLSYHVWKKINGRYLQWVMVYAAVSEEASH